MLLLFLVSLAFVLAGGLFVLYNYLIMDFVDTFGLVVIVLGVIGLSICFGSQIGETDAYKRSLQGKNPYKTVIKYQKINDSTYIPVDTIFIKK